MSEKKTEIEYGPIVAERYKKQYFKRKKWLVYPDWQIQPEKKYLILCELKSKEAVDAILGNRSWTKRISRKKS